jgi:hypothetical protein
MSMNFGTVRVASLNPFAHLARRAEPEPGAVADETAAAAGESAQAAAATATTATTAANAAPAQGAQTNAAPAQGQGAAAAATAAPVQAAAAAREIPEDGDEASDRADELDAVARATRQRERGRIRAIMLSEAGKDNPDIAMVLALGSMSRRQAIDMVQAMASISAKAKPAVETLRTRMDAVDIPAVGSEGGKEMTPTQMIVLAGKIRRGEKID